MRPRPLPSLYIIDWIKVTGFQMAKARKWAIRVLAVIAALIVLAMVAAIVMTNRTVDYIYGGQTEVVDPAQFSGAARTTAITNVSVLSPDGTEMLPGRTIIVSDGMIVSISDDEDGIGDAARIDGTGKYVIPGLVDSHVHLQRSPNDLLLYLANGVTQIRSMGGSDADVALKREIENGRIGPHFYVSSPSMNSHDGFGGSGISAPAWIPDSIVTWLVENIANTHVTMSPEEAAKDVRGFIANGYDGIKLYGFLNMESYRAILDAAEELDVPTVGHLPDAMPLSELRTTKLGEIGHLEELVKALMNEFGSIDEKGGDAFLQFVESRADEIAGDLAVNDVAVQTTLRFSESFAEQVFDLESALSRTPLEYANPGIVEGTATLGFGWLPDNNKFAQFAGSTPEERAGAREFWTVREEAHRILLKAFIKAGVTTIAGTDANGWLSVPGFSLHDELQSLNKAGMTPSQALGTATAAPANRINNNAGVIEVGRRADLVLLNENPLDDIEHTRSIDTVILNGRVLGRALLDRLLEEVKVANAKSRNFDLNSYQ